jgi:hypothetical protein
MLSDALSAFHVDPVPPLAAAVYPVEKRAWFLDKDGTICEATEPLKTARLHMVAFDPTLLMLRATEMLLRAAATHDELVEVIDLRKWFEDREVTPPWP